VETPGLLSGDGGGGGFNVTSELDALSGVLAGALSGGSGLGSAGGNSSPAPSAQSSSGGGGGSVSLAGGGSNAAKVFNTLVGRGFTAQAAAGVLGNLQHESGINPKRAQDGGGPGRGIMQWTVTDRWKTLQRWAGKRDPYALDTQVGFMLHEMDQNHLTGRIKKMTDVHAATALFENVMERAGKPMMGERYGYADRFYKQFGKNGGGKESRAIGSWDVDTDKDIRVHSGEMIVPAATADTIRGALLNSVKGTGKGVGGGGGVSLKFEPGSVVFQVNGAMTAGSAKAAAKQFVDYVAQDKRLKEVAAG
jgi:hypothetical protein